MVLKNYVYFSTLSLLLCGLVSCGHKNNETGSEAPVTVKTLTIESAATNSVKNYSGTIEENSGTSVSFATAGTVKHVYVSDGQSVSAGQLIADLDATMLQNSYNAALSILHQAQDAYTRMKKLHDSNSISEMQWVEVQSKVEQAESSEQIARRALKDARVVAPCSGIIAEKTLEPGQNVMPGASVMKIVEINKVKVNISIPENEVSTISKGMPVSVCVPALENQVFNGKITEKDVTANVLSRTYTIKATLSNPARRLMPGMICTASIGNNITESAITIPLDAVQLSDKNFYFVWTVSAGKAKKKYIDVGPVTSTGVIVKSGLSQGEKVIIEGQQKVSENMSVKEIK